MKRAENGIRVGDLGIIELAVLLRSSSKAIRAYKIPIRTARWNPEESRLALQMRTTDLHQGHEGIGFGGFGDAALHTVAGVAASIHAFELWGKPVVSQLFAVAYNRPIPLDRMIAVEAVAYAFPFIGLGHHRVLSFGRMFDAGDRDKVLEQGLMWLAVVNRIRKPYIAP